MGHQKPSPRPDITQDQLPALWEACDSEETSPLEHLIDTLNIKDHQLGICLSLAARHNRINIVRCLLERGVPFAGALSAALENGSIQILEMFKEFGWDDVNHKVDEHGSAITPLA